MGEAIRAAAMPLTGAASDHEQRLDLIADARSALIGEAFHGPAEVYRERPGSTKRLIQEKGFSAIAVEADWPDAYWIDCYVR